MNSVELRDKKQQLKDRIKEICNLAESEIRDFSDAENEEIREIRDQILNINEELSNLDVELGEEEQRESQNKEIKDTKEMEFRLLKAINDVANNKKIDAATEAVCQKGGEEMRKAGVNFEGQIQLPVDTRAAVTVATEGEDVVVTNFTNILEPLRAKNVLVQAGAKYLTGLVGDVQVPSMTAANVTWEGETAAAKDGAPTFASVKLQPKRLTAYVDISKQFLVQDSLDAEAMIRQDIVNAVNSKLEATILGSEAGTTTMPQGIFYSASALDEIVDYKDICDLEADVEDANVLGECKYVMSNKAKAALRCMARSADTTKLVMENGNIDGTEVLNTSHVEGKNLAYGDWSNLAIGQWGSLDLVIDPYTQASNGKIRLVINAFFDAKVLREDAIKVATIAD